jgi:DNA/RNA endonuclease YhcR with UshA esterase domain
MLKTLFLPLIICFVTTEATAQQKITLSEINQHIGDSITVCGKIFGGKFLDAAKNQPTFLNIGAAYPDQSLTVVIWNNTRKQFAYKPEEKLKGKTVCITGRIEIFKEKPQITIQQPGQLEEQ